MGQTDPPTGLDPERLDELGNPLRSDVGHGRLPPHGLWRPDLRSSVRNQSLAAASSDDQSSSIEPYPAAIVIIRSE